jgi:antirestriction protein
MNNEQQQPNRDEQDDQEKAAREQTRAGESGGEVSARARPRVYVASLSDYNAGRLHGAWIDADQEPEQIEAEIGRMLAQSSEPLAEEWAIHDHEGFDGVRLSEYEPLERLSQIARGISEHGPAFAAWVNHTGEDEQAWQSFADCYLGSWPCRQEFAEETIADLGLDELIAEQIPAHFTPYVRFDADAYVRDVELNGDLTILDLPDGSVAVFSP